jgi:hypothetical protein
MPATTHQAVTVGVAAVGVTDVDAVWADFTTETAAIRVRYDGGVPTGTTGHLVPAGSSFTLKGGDDIANLRMIRDAAASADAVVRVTQGNA